MAFPDLGDDVTVVSPKYGTVSGKMTRINLATQRAWLEKPNGSGAWVDIELIRQKYGK